MKHSTSRRLGAALAITVALGTTGVVASPAHAGEPRSESLDIPCTVLADGALEPLPDIGNCLIAAFEEGQWDGEKAVSTFELDYAASELTNTGFIEGLQDWLSDHEGVGTNGVIVANVQLVGDTVSYDAVRATDDFVLRSYMVDAGSYPDVRLTLTDY